MGKKPIILTHDGEFHADDVCAVSALLLFEKSAQVLRTRDEGAIAGADFVVDVGGVYDEVKNLFDHHQKEVAGERVNGIPYAAFGLVWKKFGVTFCGSKEVAAFVDRTLVSPSDANDNGLEFISSRIQGLFPYQLSDAIRSFAPTWKDNGVSLDERFMEAVGFAKRILSLEIVRAKAAIEGERMVEEAYRAASDKRVIPLSADYSWKETLARFPEPLFAVYPHDGHWMLSCVRDDPNGFTNRKNLPEAWAGLRDRALAEITGVPDAIFCHRNRFLAVARSREGALVLAKTALIS